MLRSLIHVDLPSVETDRRMRPHEWVKSLFGAEIHLKSGQEEMTVSAYTTTLGIIQGFEKAGVTNVIAFLVDKAVVYKDVNDEAHDLRLIPEAAESTGVLEMPFSEMHMVLTHNKDGIHFIFDVRVRNRVVLGGEEMTVAVSGRPEQLRIRKGESAQDYAARVKDIASKDNMAEAWRLSFQSKVDRVGSTLGQTLTGSQVVVDDARIEIIRPSRREVGRLRDLKFGDEVEPPTYRAIPTHQRRGAYADPFYYYYYDPYYDFTHYLVLDSMIRHDHWHNDHVAVVSPAGDTLFTGTEASAHTNDSWDVQADDVTFTDDGELKISHDVPESGPPSSADWGFSAVETEVGASGANVADVSGDETSGGGFFSSFFGGGDGGDDGSSCSSCGSSCGGGCGGCGGCG